MDSMAFFTIETGRQEENPMKSIYTVTKSFTKIIMDCEGYLTLAFFQEYWVIGLFIIAVRSEL